MEFMSDIQNGIDDLKPSLFELLSEEKLSSLISPSLRYLLVIATHRRPRYLLPLLDRFDEVYACLMLLVERHYLLTYGGGFTENFYSLKRERVLRTKGGELPRAQRAAPQLVRDTLVLSKTDVWTNLAVLVGLPYIKRKLDEGYDIHAPPAAAMIIGPRYDRDVLPPNATIKQRLLHYYKWFLRNVYPSVNAAYYFSLLAFNLAYLFDRSRHHSPFLWLVGTRMRRLTEADHRAFALNLQPKRPPSIRPPPARPGQSSSIFSPRTFTTTIYPRLLSSLRFLLPTSIFALRFLEWWHASDFARQLSRKAIEGLDLPPPIISGLPASKSKQPPSPPPSSTPLLGADSDTTKHPPRQQKQPPISATSHLPILTVSLPSESSASSNTSSSATCPICLSPQIVNPTACQTGYVFCYTCIFRWVDGSHDRQTAFLDGGAGEEGWAEEQGSRRGKWESGKGRCAVTGRRVLGGTEGLRRIMV
ncbi:MAG: ubiquitin-protein ligase peroxin 12 [Peltula sp. TS41687]|nr:MAG: ubiquitin-protein ligase peroxin 12 [Peltula sp. TS41687]